MRKLDQKSRESVQAVIERNRADLLSYPNVIDVEPGFPIVAGQLLREPAIILYVRQKLTEPSLLPDELAPREVEGIRVDVVQADVVKQLLLDPSNRELAAEIETAALAAVVYEGIDGDPIDAVFEISEPILCGAGPDVGWKMVERFLGETENTLTVAMYDFSADYIANELIRVARGNDVAIALTLDNETRPEEKAIQQRLLEKLGDSYDNEIIVCRKTMRFPTAYHEKVAVQDHKRFWLSSGNWSPNSQPETDPIGNPGSGWFSKGNREWHVVVDDRALAGVFERYILHDKAESEGDAALGLEDLPAYPDLFVSTADLLAQSLDAALAQLDPVAPERLPAAAQTIKVRPLLSPDNYARRVSEWIRGAQVSLDLQYSYITYSKKGQDADFRALLDHLGDLSWREDFRLRIIINKKDDARVLSQEGFNDKVFKVQSGIHNKGIVRDDEQVLVSSQNWSGDGFLRNRDAGLIIENREIARYYAAIFDDDWNVRARPPFKTAGLAAMIAPPGVSPPPGMVRMSWADFFGE